MPKVLIVGQYSGVTNYYLRAHPEPFETFVKRVVNGHHAAILMQVEDDYRPEFMTTVIRADKKGNAEVWKTNWDRQ